MTTNDKSHLHTASSGARRTFLFNDMDSYHVKSECIKVDRQILNFGQKYFISQKSGITSEIVLHYCYYRESNINLIVQEIGSKHLSIISHCLDCLDCTWVLMDLEHYNDMLAIEDFCGCSEDSKNDDLLEFDF